MMKMQRMLIVLAAGAAMLTTAALAEPMYDRAPAPREKTTVSVSLPFGLRITSHQVKGYDGGWQRDSRDGDHQVMWQRNREERQRQQAQQRQEEYQRREDQQRHDTRQQDYHQQDGQRSWRR